MIQPLGVVHGHKQRGSSRKDPECVQDPARQNLPIGHRSQEWAACERAVHGSPSRFRKFREKLLNNVAEQIIKGRAGKRPLRRGGTAR